MVLLLLLAVGVGATAAVLGDRRDTGGSAETVASGGDGSETTGPAEASVGEDFDGVAYETSFFYLATDEKSRGDYTYISDPSIDGDPDAIVMAEPTQDQVGTGAYPHDIGVWYEGGRRKWAIFNQDRARVPEGSTFRVVVPRASTSFVHYADAANTGGNRTYIDNPLTNGKADAVPSVTQNWNPGGGSGVYNDHPVGFVYDAKLERWAVYNSDGAPMPLGAAFNIAVRAEADSGAR